MGRVIPFGEPIRYGKTHKRAVRRNLPSGWTIENGSHMNRALGVTVDVYIGPEGDDGLPWGTLQLQPDTATLDVDRLYAAARAFLDEGTPVRLRAIMNEAFKVAFEVKWPHPSTPGRTDFPLTEDNFTRFLSESVVGKEVEESPTLGLNVPAPAGWQRKMVRDRPIFEHAETQTKVLLSERYLPSNVFCRVASFALPGRKTLGASLWAVATAFFDAGETIHVFGPHEVEPGTRMLVVAKSLDGQTPRGKPLLVERAAVDAFAAQLAGA